jgi:hypothetical protein
VILTQNFTGAGVAMGAAGDAIAKAISGGTFAITTLVNGVSTTATVVFCDDGPGVAAKGQTRNANTITGDGTGYEEVGQPLGATLVYSCNPGFVKGVVRFRCMETDTGPQFVTEDECVVTTNTTKRGSGSGNNTNFGTTALVVIVVLAVLTFIFAVTSIVLVTRNRDLATQVMHLQKDEPKFSLDQNQTLTGEAWPSP